MSKKMTQRESAEYTIGIHNDDGDCPQRTQEEHGLQSGRS